MCRPRIVRTMGDEPVSKKITMEVFEWSIGAMRCCSILLINHSIHVHFRFCLSAGMNFLFIGSMYRSVFTITRRQSESSNQHDAVMPLRPNPHQTVTFSTLTGDIDVLSRTPKSHVLMLTWSLGWKVASTLKKWSPRDQIFICSLTDGLPKGTSLNLTCLSPIWKQVKIWCIVRKLNFLEDIQRQTSSGFSWRFLQALSHGHNVIFCPDWTWPATATFNVILYISRLLEFVQEAFYCESSWGVSALKILPKLWLEFGQLISSQNRPLLPWSSPVRNILLLDPLKQGNKTLDL